MGKPSAPTPPDPRDTAAASTGTNVDTAIANANLQNVNRIGADGSTLTYDQTGDHTWTNEYTGETHTVPRYTATETLSDSAQSIFDSNQEAQQNLSNIGRDQSSMLQDYLGTPFQADTGEIEKHLFDLGSNTLDPKFASQREDMATRLSNQGIKMGSAAYDRAMDELGQTQNAAYTDLALSGRGQAFSELQAARNQPINEITALLSGSQVSMPNYAVNTPQGAATTDVAGIINSNYGQQLNAWQQNSANSGGALGGLFQLGGTLGSAAILSDERAKTDIKKVGKTEDGQQIYSYRYKAGGPIQMGLMAQEVEKKKPEAVHNVDGVKMVDYGLALQGST